MELQNPVVVIPGITATDLTDDYPTRREDVWSMVMNKAYDRIALHPDDLRYEAIEPSHVFPGQAFSIYDDLINFLRHELSFRADRPTPVFAFPYDWRVDVRATAVRLRAFIDEVLARTKLLKHYAGATADLKVDLVGHSMGGLVICESLAQDAKAPVGKVVTIGTPFLGSIEAVVKITTGMSLLSGSEPQEREREAARVTPAVYQLLPSYPGAAFDEAQTAVDLFDPRNMQATIVDSLAEFVRMYSSVKAEERRPRAEEILSTLLTGAKAHRDTIVGFRLSARRPASSWLAVVGIGQDTRVQVIVKRERRGPRFTIDDRQFKESDVPVAGLHATGDGTVPLNGAMPPFLNPAQLVCVGASDLGLLELKDRLLVKFGGFHGLMPAVNLVQRLTAKHLKPDFGGKVWGRRVPGLASWAPPINGLEEREL